MARQRSYQTPTQWLWECTQGHVNNNQAEYCTTCNERIQCMTAGGHGFHPDSNICDRGTCSKVQS